MTCTHCLTSSGVLLNLQVDSEITFHILSYSLVATADRENALLTGGLDLIIVPGMGFTAVCLCNLCLLMYFVTLVSQQGHRLGRGKVLQKFYHLTAMTFLS